MKVLRNILSDLIEKRLWPLAIGLLVAAIAVPVLVGRGGSDEDTAATTPAVTTSTPDRAINGAVVALEQTTTAVDRKGAVRDPFVQHHVPKPAPAVTTPAPAPAPDTTEKSSGGNGGQSDAPAATPSTPAPATNDTPAKDDSKTDDAADDTYKVNIHFGVTDHAKAIKDVTRLAPLPSDDEPFFVFMGVGEDGKSATFLIASDATPTPADGCKPSPESCDTVTLKLDDTVFFDLTNDDATVTQYELTLDKIVKGQATTAAKAQAARTAESQAGRATLRRLKALDPKLLQGWTYAADRGILVAQDVPDGVKVSAPEAAGLEAAGTR